MNKNINFPYSKGFTHGGNFHSDDVFATAFLRLLNPNIEIYRGFIVPENYDGIVYDIGGGEFDHHMKDNECREYDGKQGRPYAAFGKLWRKYGDLLVSSFVKQNLDNEFISILDESDNTGKINTLSSIIYNLNGFWYEEDSKEKQDERFFDAVDMAQKILVRYIEKFEGVEKAEKYVLECYQLSKDGFVIFDKYVPWKNTLKGTDVKVVLYPSNRGGYNVERVENSGFEFPEVWWGTRDEAIVPGLTFCHSSGFLACFDTMDNAIKAIKNRIKELGCENAKE